ncbi:hypothetical protein FRC00_005696 [Tulasnella sp. 408]|nr:hypothetical protein FRC00_005696 [Tulasnella sp. 408]
MTTTLDILLSRCARADLISLNQYILTANSQVLIAIAITPPQPDPQTSRNLALSSAVVTLFAILAAMALSSAEANAPGAVGDRRVEKGIKLFALGVTLVALVLFVTAIATIRS